MTNTDVDAYIDSLRAIHLMSPTIFDRLAKETGTENRRFFAPNPEELFHRSPHLATERHRFQRIVPSWYANTVLNNREKFKIVLSACMLVGLVYWEDIEIQFSVGHYSPPTKEEAIADARRMLKELETE